MNVYRLAYGKNSVFYSHADQVLAIMKEAKSIRREELHRLVSWSSSATDFQETLSYLVDEGFVESNEWAYSITTKGGLFLGRGGYKREARRKVAGALAGIVAALAAVCTIVAVVA